MRILSISNLTILALTLIVVTACESRKATMIKKGYPVAYADGFEDGCHSGKKAGGSLFEQFKKDVVRFERQPRYAQGWSDGFRQCESEEEAQQRQTRMSIELQHLDDERRNRLTKDALKGVDTSGLKSLKKTN